MSKPRLNLCPCGGGEFDQCCGRYIQQGLIAPTAEALMRSRYSAYVLGDEAYLKKTWHASTRPSEAILTGEHVNWMSLDVRNHSWESESSTAQVEFLAKCKVGGRAHRLHEVSDFVQEDGHWFYVSGVYPEAS